MQGQQGRRRSKELLFSHLKPQVQGFSSCVVIDLFEGPPRSSRDSKFSAHKLLNILCQV